MKSRFAALFADGESAEPHGAKPQRNRRVSHTLETDTPDTDENSEAANKEAAQKKLPDTFVELDDMEIGTTQTAKRWALAIEDRHPQIIVRQIASVGHPVNLYGCWAIERPESGTQGMSYRRLRYADNIQLRELYEALGDTDKFWNLAYGDDLPGPYRVNKPPIDAHGNPLIENEPDRGDHGPLPDECAWIEAHDDAFVRYAGTDPVWPTGCWEVNKSGYDRQLCDAAQVKFIAHDILGMPNTPAKARAQTKAEKAAHFASLGLEAVPNGGGHGRWNEESQRLEALTTEEAEREWVDRARAKPKADLKAARPAIASLFAETPTPKPASRFSKLFD